MSKVVSLAAYRKTKETTVGDILITEEWAYRAKILTMTREELLEEMIRFQEQRKLTGALTPAMMYQGRHLFRALEENACSQELKILARSYCRHLEYEIAAMRENSNV